MQNGSVSVLRPNKMKYARASSRALFMSSCLDMNDGVGVTDGLKNLGSRTPNFLSWSHGSEALLESK